MGNEALDGLNRQYSAKLRHSNPPSPTNFAKATSVKRLRRDSCRLIYQAKSQILKSDGE